MLFTQHPSLNDRGRHVGRLQHVALPNTSLGCVGTPGSMEAIVKTLTIEEINHVEDSTVELETVYWHILDYARNNGTWTPPIKGL